MLPADIIMQCSEPKLLLLVIIMHVASYIIMHALFMCRVLSVYLSFYDSAWLCYFQYIVHL
jgi:hypothetical protein